MLTENDVGSEIEEFLPSTKDDTKDDNVDTSKTAKYKVKKKTEIIVFPEIKNKKSKNNNSPKSSKDVENFKNHLL